ncbi:hypothetical protein N803_14240 [Knoellia subterranea KCTC 19937]|uniref:Uncharacterized protein n=1 Tax=Knoellia subterranea KCTC 19937 TaxID=1385521 RepID=A0A0A0JLI1_9MICO|nr:hypothetical protein N803_14240 [Knoellia subterranea KCTC 19937]
MHARVTHRGVGALDIAGDAFERDAALGAAQVQGCQMVCGRTESGLQRMTSAGSKVPSAQRAPSGSIRSNIGRGLS